MFQIFEIFYRIIRWNWFLFHFFSFIQAAHLARHSRDAKPAAHQEQRLFSLPRESSRRSGRELHRSTGGSRDTGHSERSLPVAVSKALQPKAICQSSTSTERDPSREATNHPGDTLQMRENRVREHHDRRLQSTFAPSTQSHLRFSCRCTDAVPSQFRWMVAGCETLYAEVSLLRSRGSRDAGRVLHPSWPGIERRWNLRARPTPTTGNNQRRHHKL